MEKQIKIIKKGAVTEIIEKKSRFIAEIIPVSSEEEAIQFIEEIRKKNWNATHNCYAYTLGDNNEIQRFSDDGEPGGTAGRPMLEVLTENHMHDAAVVVTRYFGGTLLGTGGLIRTYRRAVNAALENCEILVKLKGCLLTVKVSYTDYGKIQHMLENMEMRMLETEYTEMVQLTVVLEAEKKEAFAAALREATNAKAIIVKDEEVFFAHTGGKPVLL
ncbi:YigZ family protein [Parasporobacterium paucivorans]|uniref:Uncharacterized protein, YigZ family n=1 Tax=Parasporobacterium paucivorans DSM 15970 TaxID=1122934 RepID=A0A1M6CC35_9FIRM|nr:YigZ family protein [Parasporobacterium paucivorans]SHI58557.1 uncharacterized protein, YigZ family [Parasporobacterium paucivorans DSM 15970]